MSEPVGRLDIVLYAGIRGEPPVEVGTAWLPIVLSTTKNNTLEVNLQEALDYVRADIKQIFGREK